MLMNEIKGKLSKWRDSLCPWVGKINILKLSVLPVLTYIPNSNQNPSILFYGYGETYSKVDMEKQRPRIANTMLK